MTTVTVDTTLVEKPTVYGNTERYNVAEIIMPNNVTDVAVGAGQAVTTAIAFAGDLPPTDDYTVSGTPSMACTLHAANKTTAGFDLVQTPLSSGVTLASGTVDLVVTWDNGAVQ